MVIVSQYRSLRYADAAFGVVSLAMRTFQNGVVGPLLAGAVLLVTVGASAGNTAASAELLFRDGTALMNKGELGPACRKLARSHQLDPAPGTLFYIATCYEKQGRAASAWATYHEAAELARKGDQKELADEASSGAERLQSRFFSLVLEVAAADTEGLRIVRKDRFTPEGVEIESELWANPIPIDSGEHQFEVSAPGKTTWHSKIGVPKSPGKTAELGLDIPELVDAATGPAGVSESPVDAESDSVPTLAYLGFGVGAAGLVLGTVAGIMHASEYSDVDERCPGTVCDNSVEADYASAMMKAHIATVGFGLAIIGTGVGLWSWLSHDGGDSVKAARRRGWQVAVAPAWRPSGGGVFLTGQY